MGQACTVLKKIGWAPNANPAAAAKCQPNFTLPSVHAAFKSVYGLDVPISKEPPWSCLISGDL